MGQISNRAEMANFCLRKLGAPVIKINLAQEQLDDRIDEAIRYFQEFHIDAIERTYWKHKITKADVATGYFILPDNVLSVNRIISLGGTAFDMFIEQEFVVPASDGDPSDWLHDQYIRNKHADEFSNILATLPTFQFTRNLNKVVIFGGVKDMVGKTAVFECESLVDQNVSSKFWNDIWLIRYATALIERQWAQNLSKFSGISMVGGVTFDAQGMLDRSQTEIEKLEETMKSTYTDPLGYVIMG